MRYTESIEIDLPPERVGPLLMDPANFGKWQPTFLGHELIEGEACTPCAKTKLRYKWGKREMEVLETLVDVSLPHSYTGRYETKGVWNEVENRFEDLGGRTRWVCISEFRFSGFMKIIGFLFKGSFPRQTRKDLQSFKDWADQQAGSPAERS
jgi:hypothetical protein